MFVIKALIFSARVFDRVRDVMCPDSAELPVHEEDEITGYRRLKPPKELKLPGPHRAVKNIRYFEEGKEVSANRHYDLIEQEKVPQGRDAVLSSY